MGTQAERVVYECVQYHKEISITALFTYMQRHVHCVILLSGGVAGVRQWLHMVHVYMHR